MASDCNPLIQATRLALAEQQTEALEDEAPP
jgi:hypothetical protein